MTYRNKKDEELKKLFDDAVAESGLPPASVTTAARAELRERQDKTANAGMRTTAGTIVNGNKFRIGGILTVAAFIIAAVALIFISGTNDRPFTVSVSQAQLIMRTGNSDDCACAPFVKDDNLIEYREYLSSESKAYSVNDDAVAMYYMEFVMDGVVCIVYIEKDGVSVSDLDCYKNLKNSYTSGDINFKYEKGSACFKKYGYTYNLEITDAQTDICPLLDEIAESFGN